MSVSIIGDRNICISLDLRISVGVVLIRESLVIWLGLRNGLLFDWPVHLI